MSENKVVRLHPHQITIHEFIAQVVAEVEDFKGTKMFVVIFNDKEERAIMKHNLTVADGALIAMDCIKLVNDGPYEDE